MDIVFIIGRVLFAILFVGAGIGHFKALEAMTGYAQYKKLPAAKAGVIVSGLIFLLGGLSVAFGVYGVYGALAIAAVLFPTAIIFHNYWTVEDAQAKQTEKMAFNKDIALAGAALVVAYVYNIANVAGVLIK
ncbi:MAG: hypothetical protein RL410_1494 [Actinomycetota bacterium]